MKIGKIVKRVVDGIEILEGYVSTLNLNIKFRLEQNKNKQSPNAPDYTIVTNGASGETPIGAVWIKLASKLGLDTEEFFSMTFDDPSFPHSLNVAAFPAGAGSSHWDITWRRRQSNSANS